MEATAVRRVCIPVAAAGRSGTPGGPTILLVSDDSDLRAAAARVLEAAGWTVRAAAHSGHALLACLTAGRIDVLATELLSNEGSGPALAERVRRYHPDIQALYFAACGTRARTNVLVRPFTRDDLIERVETMASCALAR